MYNGINKIAIHKTRFNNLGYANTNPAGSADWRFVDCSDGSEATVGPRYTSKEELLSDLTRFGNEWSGA